ncbi:MAG: glucose-6-phosphate isomerase [Methylococcales bacterium]|nr:glucose-6-phosphate isomerase [Methylococcales bacterium]
MSQLTQSAAWKSLEQHLANMRGFDLKAAFADNPDRFARFSLTQDTLLYDFSKNWITEETLNLLVVLAEQQELGQKIEDQFNGVKINHTEQRAVLHTALRNRSSNPVYVDGHDVMPKVRQTLEQMRVFSERVRSGQWRGWSGKAMTDIVNIGIGGSNLGPKMVVNALRPYCKEGLKTHFVSNVDQADLLLTLGGLNAETTLFVIASKVFNTQETMTNARSAKDWFLEQIGAKDAIRQHFVAISTNAEQVSAFGIDPENMFEFWDWVGGRFSLWSAIGLSIALSIGMERFESLLDGAHEMDCHFRNTDYRHNIPVIMALIGIWYNNFHGAETQALLPYDQSLKFFTDYMQQGDMESNGKSRDREGNLVDYQTGPIIWGQPGTNGQHAFFQLIHQGTKLIPCDFIAAANSHYPLKHHHDILISNFLAQPEALMHGKNKAEVLAELRPEQRNDAALVASRIFPGNKPSSTFLVEQLTPKTLGALIACYEHKIFTQGAIWNINSFDQMGVELGKTLARSILPELTGSPGFAGHAHDSSTQGLIDAYLKQRR